MNGNTLRTVVTLSAGWLLIGSFAAAGEKKVPRHRKATRVPWIVPAQYEVAQPPLPPEPRYNPSVLPPIAAPVVPPPLPLTPAEKAAAAAAADWAAPKPIKCPPVGPLTLRPVPAGDGYGRMTCHLSFTGDCYGENWRLQNWRRPLWNMPQKTSRFHLKTHNHSLWAERFLAGLFGKTPNGYVHDTSGWALKSYVTPQPDDPAIPYVEASTAMVYDYPQYVYAPSSCAPIGACPADPVASPPPGLIPMPIAPPMQQVPPENPRIPLR